ncbi:MAG: hypothetical protein LAT58_13300 [Opitutales bacterium]|nr:hypothetical protein [Opitutales bacterium]
MHKLWQRPLSAAEVAAHSSDPETFGRNLRDWQHELRRITSRQAFAQRIQEPPPLLAGKLRDHGQCDAYLAAYVDWLCQRHGVPVPDWANDTERCAVKAWYDYPPLWQDALINAPGAFRRRGVFTRPDDVLRFRPGRPPMSSFHKRRKSAERQRRYRARIREKLRSLSSGKTP